MDDVDDPESHRLHLSDGRFVDIRKRLNHGQTEDLFARISPYGVGVDRRMTRTAKILAYVLAWNLTKKGVPIPMSEDLPENVRLDTVRNLNSDRAIEIHKAIEAHEAVMEQEAADLKKTPAGKPAAPPISGSPSAPAGASTGSGPSPPTTTTGS